MDYKIVRQREKMKKRGIKVSGGELKKPAREIDRKRLSIILIIALIVVAVGIGAVIIKTNDIEFSILPPAPTAEPSGDSIAEEITDGDGNALPVVEAPNTYDLD